MISIAYYGQSDNTSKTRPKAATPNKSDGGWKISKIGNPYLVQGDLIAVCWPIATFDATLDQVLATSLSEIEALPTSVKMWGWRVKAKQGDTVFAKGNAPDEATAKALAAKIMADLIAKKGRAN